MIFFYVGKSEAGTICCNVRWQLAGVSIALMGIKYLRVEAYSQRKPLVILLGIGSNLGSHEGTSPLNVMIQDISRYLGMATVIAAGKETGRGHHYMGSVPMEYEFTHYL